MFPDLFRVNRVFLPAGPVLNLHVHRTFMFLINRFQENSHVHTFMPPAVRKHMRGKGRAGRKKDATGRKQVLLNHSSGIGRHAKSCAVKGNCALHLFAQTGMPTKARPPAPPPALFMAETSLDCSSLVVPYFH